MPNPKGTPENLQPLSTDRDEPLTETYTLRVSESMKESIKAQDNPQEFCRGAIQNALDKLDTTD